MLAICLFFCGVYNLFEGRFVTAILLFIAFHYL